MAGVVSEEKVMVLDVVSSGVKRPINWLMMEVLAVPGPPTSRDTWLVQLLPLLAGARVGDKSRVQVHKVQ